LFADPKQRFDVKQIIRHPWFQRGLVKGAEMINTMLVNESRTRQPTSEELETIKSLVKEAQTLPRRLARQQTGGPTAIDEGSTWSSVY
jgi:hypothetical protein